jgi:hypothetical protein
LSRNGVTKKGTEVLERPHNFKLGSINLILRKVLQILQKISKVGDIYGILTG